MRLPERIERDYMTFNARIMHDVGRIARPKLLSSHLLRVDAEDDPRIEQLADVLGISAAALINRKKLRARLHRFARRLSVEKQAQLSALLGRWIREPDGHLVDQWVVEQERLISRNVDAWLSAAAIATALGASEDSLAFSTAAAATRARNVASSAVLALNTALLANAAVANGLSSYRWVTQDDDAVRDNHRELHFTIQSWSNPPVGGGTKEGEVGHPGEGFGCRCIAEPVGALTFT